MNGTIYCFLNVMETEASAIARGLRRRDPELLDPAKDPARVRAMYTHPDFARRGVGRLILQLCEDAARAEGFKRLELMGTLSGRPLYESYGFQPIEEILDDRGGEPVPLTRMGKTIPT